PAHLGLLVTVHEAVVLLLRAVLRIAVALLEQSDHLLGPALGLVELVIGELAPLLLDLPLHLLPLAGRDVLVHDGLLRLLELGCSWMRSPTPRHHSSIRGKGRAAPSRGFRLHRPLISAPRGTAAFRGEAPTRENPGAGVRPRRLGAAGRPAR